MASQVSEWFIGAEPRAASEPQRLSLRERYGVNDDRLLKVLAKMEAAVEKPVSRNKLAEIAGVSTRSLERLFIRHRAQTLTETYMRIRLDQASQLVRKTSMTITNIALACGFQSSSHFSRAFKQRFGDAPSRDRDTGRKQI